MLGPSLLQDYLFDKQFLTHLINNDVFVPYRVAGTRLQYIHPLSQVFIEKKFNDYFLTKVKKREI